MIYPFRSVAFVLLILSSNIVLGDTIYTIGNSLTWDTKPYDLDGDVDYHIFCGKNLQFIYDNPEGHCVASSLPWTTALATKQYDWISVQPFAGTTLSQDVSVISAWMVMQPTAKLVIHPAWTGFSRFPTDYAAGNPDDMMRPSPEYIADLIDALQAIDAGRDIRSTKTNDRLYSIWQDTEAGIGPFDSLHDLSRDWIHMGHNTGRYFAHNSLRLAMNQRLSDEGFTIDPAIKSYFDAKLTAIPEPTSAATFIFLTIIGIATRTRRSSGITIRCTRSRTF